MSTDATDKVVFPGQMGRAPAAHIPGQPAERGLDGRPVAMNPALGMPYGVKGVQFHALNPDAAVPALGTEQAAGYDLTTPAAVTLKPGERTTIPLGFALGLPADLHGRIESRSGLALKGLVVLTGVIDADYRGEVKVIMQNFGDKPHEFAAGDRVAQLVLRPTVHRSFMPVDALEATTRGSGGFGSTGA